MSKKLLMVMSDGVEEAEAIIVLDVLRRLGVDIKIAGLNAVPVVGAHQITILTDGTFDELASNHYDAVVLPGGAQTLADSTALRSFLQKFYSEGKSICAICAGPIVLANAGLLKNKRFTAYPGLENYFAPEVPTSNLTESDGRIITGRGPGASFAFAKAIAEHLGLGAEVKQVYKQMLVSEC